MHLSPKLILVSLFALLLFFACSGDSSNDPQVEHSSDAGGSPSVPSPDARPQHSRMFVTSTQYTGNLGGLAGADALCQGAALAGSLGGTWRAWLSTPSVNAIDRIQDVSPWYLIDRETLVFPVHASLRGPSLVPIGQNEYGPFDWETMGFGDRVVRTGSQSGIADDTCSGFTSASGDEYGTYGWLDEPDEWGGVQSGRCDSSNARLYCFEQ